MKRIIRLLIFLFAVWPSAHVARAEDSITFTLGRFEGSRACGAPCAEFIVAKGTISAGAALGYIRSRAKSGDRDLPIILESPGGYVSGAIALARSWRHVGATVIVATAIPTCSHTGRSSPRCAREDADAGVLTYGLGGSALCASACTLAIAGGTRRIALPGTQFGVHAPGIDFNTALGRTALKMGVKPEDMQRDTVSRMSRHFRDFDIDPALGQRSAQTANEKMDWLTLDEARNYRLVNATPSDLDPASPVGRMLRAILGR